MKVLATMEAGRRLEAARRRLTSAQAAEKKARDAARRQEWARREVQAAILRAQRLLDCRTCCAPGSLTCCSLCAADEKTLQAIKKLLPPA